MTKPTDIHTIFPPLSRNECLDKLREDNQLYQKYNSLNTHWQEEFLDFMSGKKTLPLTYDPIFKKLFNPEIYPERLSDLISSIIRIPVTVIRALPLQESILEGNALLIMDILVQLEDGSLANVEVQKIPYMFPAERMSCYSSDLVLRQYSRVKGEKGKAFTYKDMRPVYTIIFFEKSLPEFKTPALNGNYLHFGKTVFDTGLELELLLRFYLIFLDVFSGNKYPMDKNNRVTAWLSLLATRNVDDLTEILDVYPWLEAIYQDMASYLHKPEEVLTMFSDALKILDHNTVQYMIDEMQNTIDDQKAQLSDKDSQLADKNSQLADKNAQLTDMHSQLADKDSLLTDMHSQLADKDSQLTDMHSQLADKNSQIAGKDSQINDLAAEIAALKKQLAAQQK